MIKKLFAVFVLTLALTVPNVAHADYVSILDFAGAFEFSGNQDIDGEGGVCDTVDFVLCTDADTSDDGEDFGYFALEYELELNLPPDPGQEYSWWLEVKFGLAGVSSEGGPFVFQFDESFDLGEFALGISEDNVSDFFDFLTDEFGPFAIAEHEGFECLFVGDVESGELVCLDYDENIFDFDDDEFLVGAFIGEIVLTAHTDENESNVIPEPASLILFGSGLIGFARTRRKKVLS